MTDCNGCYSAGVHLDGVIAPFYRTRAGLELSIRELVGPQHQAAVAHLPDWHPNVDGVPEPKWRKRNKHRVLDLGGRKNTIARGARIRQKVVAQQHLQTSLTITLEDGSTTRVWLAAGKDVKKIIGDSLSGDSTAQDGLRHQ